MKVELTGQQIDSLLLSIDASLSQLAFAKVRHDEYYSDIEKDIELIKKIKEKVLLINTDSFTALTKYETYTLINSMPYLLHDSKT